MSRSDRLADEKRIRLWLTSAQAVAQCRHDRPQVRRSFADGSPAAAGLSHAVADLAHGQPVHVDERCGGGLDDGDHRYRADLGGSGSNGSHLTCVSPGIAQRRAGRQPGPQAVFSGDAALGRGGGGGAEHRGLSGLDVAAAAVGTDLCQRHRSGHALAGVCRHRPRDRSPAPTAGGAGAQWCVNERFAHRGPAGGRRPDRQCGNGLGVSVQCSVVAGGRDRHQPLAAGAPGESAGTGAAGAGDACRSSARHAVGPPQRRAAADLRVLFSLDRGDGPVAPAGQGH